MSFFKKIFSAFRKETPGEMLRKLNPELFDESGNTYNSGDFADSEDSIKLTAEQLILFPDIESIYYKPTKFDKEHFLPLCTFDLSIINHEWNFKAVFICIQKTESDELESRLFLNEYGDYNITIFERLENKIVFKGHKEVFQYDDDEKRFWNEVKESQTSRKREYEVQPKDFFASQKINVGSIVRQLNSTPKWIQSEEKPSTNLSDQAIFIGQLNKGNLINVEGWIFLYFIPNKNLFIQIEQNT